jgi:hypothetical protein
MGSTVMMTEMQYKTAYNAMIFKKKVTRTPTEADLVDKLKEKTEARMTQTSQVTKRGGYESRK